MAWDPKRYLQFGSQRTRPVFELAGRIPIEAPRTVYDLGCGPGNSAEVLAARWPEAKIIGVDNSPEMLERARDVLPSAEWQLGDLETWAPEKPADVLFANASLQWITRPEATVKRLFDAVAPGGALAFQVPANLDEPPLLYIDEVLNTLGFAGRVNTSLLSRHVLEAAAYYRLLAPKAKSVDVWDTRYLHVLQGEDAVLSWIKGTALVPVVAQLGTDADTFVAALKTRLREVYPREPGGETLLPFRRRFVVALR